MEMYGILEIGIHKNKTILKHMNANFIIAWRGFNGNEITNCERVFRW